MKSITLTAIMTLTAATATPQSPSKYPIAPKADVTDTYFGTIVADPYRQLENDTAAATLQWVEAERALTDSYLSKIPFRDQIHNRITSFQNYAKTSLPWYGNDGRRYFYSNSGLANQSTLYRENPSSGQREIFLDPNTLSDDGTVALTGVFQSKSGKYTAYTISRSGSDWTEIYLLDTATGNLLTDHIQWAKFTSAVWNGDDGFFYSAYERPTDGKEFSNANTSHRVYYHKIGTPQQADTLFYEDPSHPLYFHSVFIPEKSRHIFLQVGGQGFGEEIYVKPLDNLESPWLTLQDNMDDVTSVVGIRNGKIYFTTSADAPNYRLMSAPVDKPQRENWTEVIPQRPDAILSNVEFTKDKMVLLYEKDASSRLYIFDEPSARLTEIPLPTIGTVGLSCDQDHDTFLYSIVSFTSPWQHYRYDPATGESTLADQGHIANFNPDDYITEEVFYPSADGTPVHMFLTYKKGLERNGDNPVYLYGYGGFNISLPPSFSPNRLIWLENGGIYAQANLRGGAEYGDKWHQAGTKLNKLNVFNDFIAAAEYLIAQNYTSPDRLVIEGGSNGGLLVGATVNLRPDLFAVAIPRVGVMDMMRYHLFTIGWNWASDYGTSADSPEMATYLLSYSPIHNIPTVASTPYPAILVTTADHDDRVVPAHSFKYAATLQAADTGSAPKLIRIDSKAGHGAGKPISKVIDEQTDIYSFIFNILGITPAE